MFTLRESLLINFHLVQTFDFSSQNESSHRWEDLCLSFPTGNFGSLRLPRIWLGICYIPILIPSSIPRDSISTATMPSLEREESRDRELVLKHQPSFSESGRASVPMYVSLGDGSVLITVILLRFVPHEADIFG